MVSIGDDIYYSNFVGPNPGDFSDPIEIGPITEISSDRKTIVNPRHFASRYTSSCSSYILVIKPPLQSRMEQQAILWWNQSQTIVQMQ